MIRIQRPAKCAGYVPGGEQATNDLFEVRAADATLGKSKANPLHFIKRIYGPRAVKQILRAGQFDKCCFCENYFAGNYPGDVEHFRPKARVKQSRGQPLVYPGYFWLAYRWDNLTYACFMCNASAKGDQFPVADPAHRAVDDAGLPLEGAQLIDPAIEDPRVHIRFAFTKPVAKSERGEMTIDVLKLDRADLERPRLSHIKHLDALLRLATRPGGRFGADREGASAELNEALLPCAIFTSMSRDYLVRNGWPAAVALEA